MATLDALAAAMEQTVAGLRAELAALRNRLAAIEACLPATPAAVADALRDAPLLPQAVGPHGLPASPTGAAEPERGTMRVPAREANLPEPASARVARLAAAEEEMFPGATSGRNDRPFPRERVDAAFAAMRDARTMVARIDTLEGYEGPEAAAHISAARRPLRDGEPCGHPGCLSHHSHPCEGCGRTGGRGSTPARRPLAEGQLLTTADVDVGSAPSPPVPVGVALPVPDDPGITLTLGDPAGATNIGDLVVHDNTAGPPLARERFLEVMGAAFGVDTAQSLAGESEPAPGIDIQTASLADFLALRHREFNENIGAITGLVAIPGAAEELHESGYRMMTFAAERQCRAFCLVGGGTDDLNLHGDGWRVDCLPASGLLHLWRREPFSLGEDLSSLDTGSRLHRGRPVAGPVPDVELAYERVVAYVTEMQTRALGLPTARVPMGQQSAPVAPASPEETAAAPRMVDRPSDRGIIACIPGVGTDCGTCRNRSRCSLAVPRPALLAPVAAGSPDGASTAVVSTPDAVAELPHTDRPDQPPPVRALYPAASIWYDESWRGPFESNGSLGIRAFNIPIPGSASQVVSVIGDGYGLHVLPGGQCISFVVADGVMSATVTDSTSTIRHDDLQPIAVSGGMILRDQERRAHGTAFRFESASSPPNMRRRVLMISCGLDPDWQPSPEAVAAGRGTGRTTRTLLSALEDLRDQRQVTIVARTKRYAEQLRRRLLAMCHDAGVASPPVAVMSYSAFTEEGVPYPISVFIDHSALGGRRAPRSTR